MARIANMGDLEVPYYAELPMQGVAKWTNPFDNARLVKGIRPLRYPLHGQLCIVLDFEVAHVGDARHYSLTRDTVLSCTRSYQKVPAIAEQMIRSRPPPIVGGRMAVYDFSCHCQKPNSST